jgi:hypothetical protein
MAELDMQIRELLDEGLRPFSIASILNIPLEMVYDTVDAMDADTYDESIDGDFDSAMASAGMGTDEDYGYYGDED